LKVSEPPKQARTVYQCIKVPFAGFPQVALFLFPAIYLKAKQRSGFPGRCLYIYHNGTAVKPKGEVAMLQPYQDNHTVTFSMLNDMLEYHDRLTVETHWERTEVPKLRVEPLDETSPYYRSLSAFDSIVSEEAVIDTSKNLQLAIGINKKFYPLRDTAYKSLLDRAKISGSSLPKLQRKALARTLNDCMATQKTSNALLLIRDQKVSAVHSGDEKDYSILPVNELMVVLIEELKARFPGNEFTSGYSDHSIVSAAWSLPDQKERLLGNYQKTLAAQGKSGISTKLMPGIRFSTSDTGVASAKVSALLLGLRYPIQIGGVVATEHRGKAKVSDFEESLDFLFAKFSDSVAHLEKMTSVYLNYPVNAMTAVCKKLSMPKKAALEAIAMFEMACGSTATAHDIFMGMQEIMFMLKAEGTAESKMLLLEESMARALTLDWRKFDYAKAVGW
jgi:hypothetical protein